MTTISKEFIQALAAATHGAVPTDDHAAAVAEAVGTLLRATDDLAGATGPESEPARFVDTLHRLAGEHHGQ